MKNTTIKFFGTTACMFDKNDDTPCFLINNKYLFDTGWALVNNLVNCDIVPADIKYLFFTHMHHDHYIALPQILFYYLQSGASLEQLKIIGPKADVKRIAEKALNFIEAKKFWNTNIPEVIELCGGDTYETEDMVFETVSSIHGVEGLCYRITDKATGKVIAATGDTAKNEKLPKLFKNCDLLIHEVSLGMDMEILNTGVNHGHSTVQNAVSLANEVNARSLFFVHNSRANEAEFIEYADENYKSGKAKWPNVGEEYIV